MPNYTRKAIQDSFLKLLNEKPIRQITIREIVDDCGVNRNTFYYYYQDLPQLVESIANEYADRIIHDFPEIHSLEKCLEAAIDFALKNRRAVLHIFHSANRDLYEQYQWRVCEHAVTTYLDTILAGHSISPSDRSLLIDFVESLCFGIVMKWLESGMKSDIQAQLHRICELEQGHLNELIARCENSGRSGPSADGHSAGSLTDGIWAEAPSQQGYPLPLCFPSIDLK